MLNSVYGMYLQFQGDFRHFYGQLMAMSVQAVQKMMLRTLFVLMNRAFTVGTTHELLITPGISGEYYFTVFCHRSILLRVGIFHIISSITLSRNSWRPVESHKFI